ncbi:tektin-1 [Salarias fasciatus]|uniref:Tektin n=1 Tax=Salarias fasciatus TaxID=181472 RepID=A0A672IXA1_SALFA|nr:tektin-1-like [Salarias fasciatus]
MSVLERSPRQGAIPSLLNHSELFREQCKQLMLEATKSSKRMQDDDSNQLNQRIGDIQFVKQELELKLEKITVEIDALIALQSRVEKALEATKEPLRVTLLCLEERVKRFPSEMLDDDVDAELRKEKEVFEEVACLLQRVAEQITEQIRLNRSAKYRLEQDLKEKYEAQTIDNSCAIMTAHSKDHLQLQSTGLSQISVPVTVEHWEDISHVNMTEGEKQSTNSESLRALVESVLEQTAADMRNKIQATAAAFELNIQEIKSAKSQMEDKMLKIQAEISGQQRIREDLQAAVLEIEGSLSLAQARLALRQQRPGKEQCHDLVQTLLLSEVQQLTAHISKLREELMRSEEMQRSLISLQLQLQENINVKSSSLYIDEVRCLQHREPVLIHNF